MISAEVNKTMASRYSTKADPAIKKNVRRARASAHKAKYTHGSVVATSIVATLLAWAMFSYQDAQAQAAEQAKSTQAAITITVPQQDAAGTEAITTQVPSGPAVTFRKGSRE